LLEIITVLVLLGIASIIVVSAFPKSDAGLVSEVDRLKSHLRYAQIRAQSDTHEWRLVFSDDRTYQIGPVVIPGAGFTPDVVPGTGATERLLEDGITATSGTAIRFDSWGRPLTDGGTPLFSNQTITLTAGDQSRSITIQAQTGLIP
jgi:Tfp pilus assembly protein FimT